MRVLFLLVFLAGLAAIAYPSLSTEGGAEIGTWQLDRQGDGYVPVEVSLRPSPAPVAIAVDMTVSGWSPGNGAPLTLVADRGNRTVLATVLTFEGTSPRETNPQKQERIYHMEAGVISATEDATYRFVIDPGDDERASGAIRSVRLTLRSVSSADRRIRPAGFILASIGFAGLLFAWVRGRSIPVNPNSQPPERRWGRDVRRS